MAIAIPPQMLPPAAPAVPPGWTPSDPASAAANAAAATAMQQQAANAAAADYAAKQAGDPSSGDSGGGGSDGSVYPGYGAGRSQYTVLPRPDYLQGAYVPPTWDQSFTAPTAQDAMNDPGYALGMQEGQQAIQRSAASQGSILNPGTVKGLSRFSTDYAANRYTDVFNRAFQTYQQKYGEFSDSANRSAQARGINENAYEFDVGAQYNQYLARYNAYQDAVRNNLDTSQLGLSATEAGAPTF